MEKIAITSTYNAVYNPVHCYHIRAHFDRATIRRVWLHTVATRTIARHIPTTTNTTNGARFVPAHDVLVYPRAVYRYTAGRAVETLPDGAPRLAHVPAYTTNDTEQPLYSRPRATAAPAAVYIPANSPTTRNNGASIPAPEYNSSVAAKNSIAPRIADGFIDVYNPPKIAPINAPINAEKWVKYSNVQALATRATISAVKLAISPRARFVKVEAVDETTAEIDGETVNITTLESADGDARGSYTDTLKNALVSLQKYAHSGVEAYPENSDAAELLSVATLEILEQARRVGIDAETWSSGYNADGTPLTRIITNHKEAGNIVTGYRAVFATITAAVNSAIRGEKTRQDSKVSIDAVSMGNSTKSPAAYDIPDFYSMDKGAALELSDTIRYCIVTACKKQDVAARRCFIASKLSAGYTQAEIAVMVGRSQSAIAKDIAAIRDALASIMDNSAAIGYSAYTATYTAAQKAAKDSGEKFDRVAAEKAAEKAARVAVLASRKK
jgi:hypothetical protein